MDSWRGYLRDTERVVGVPFFLPNRVENQLLGILLPSETATSVYHI